MEIILILFGVVGGLLLSSISRTKSLKEIRERQDRLLKMPSDVQQLRNTNEMLMDKQWNMVCEIRQDPNRIPPTLLEEIDKFEAFLREHR